MQQTRSTLRYCWDLANGSVAPKWDLSLDSLAAQPYRIVVAVVQLLVVKEQRVSDEDEDGSQDERDEHLDVDVVPGTVQLPEET